MSDLYLGNQLIIKDFKEGQRIPIFNLKPDTLYTVSLKEGDTVVDATSFTTLAGFYLYLLAPYNYTEDANQLYNWWSLRELSPGRLSDKDNSVITEDIKDNPNTFYSNYYIPTGSAQAVVVSANQLPANNDVAGVINAYNDKLELIKTLATIKADGNSIEQTFALPKEASYIRYSLPWGLNNDFQQMIYLQDELNWNRLASQGQSFTVDGKTNTKTDTFTINPWSVDLNIDPRFLNSQKTGSYFNGTYTLSGNIKGLSDYNPHNFRVVCLNAQGEELAYYNAAVTDTNEYTHFTCKISFGDLNFNTLNPTVSLRLYTNKGGTIGSADCPATFSNIRLERGNSASQWQISPDSLKSNYFRIISKTYLSNNKLAATFDCPKPYQSQNLWLVVSQRNYEVGDDFTTFSQSNNAEISTDTAPNLVAATKTLSRLILPAGMKSHFKNLIFDDYKIDDITFDTHPMTSRQLYLVELLQNNYFLNKELISAPPQVPVTISQETEDTKVGSVSISKDHLTTPLQLSKAKGSLLVNFDIRGLNHVPAKITIGLFDGKNLDKAITKDFPIVNGHLQAQLDLDTLLQGNYNYTSLVIYAADGGATGSKDKKSTLTNLSVQQIASRNYLTNQNFLQGLSDTWSFNKDAYSWKITNAKDVEHKEQVLTIPLNYKYPAFTNKVTVSFNMDATDRVLMTNFGIYDKDNNLVTAVGNDRVVTNEANKADPDGSRWQRVYLTYDFSQLTPPKNSSANIYKLIFKTVANSSGYAEIKDIKVEEGLGSNELFTPAPEDLDTTKTVYKVVKKVSNTDSELQNLTYKLTSPYSEGVWLLSSPQEYNIGDTLESFDIEGAYLQNLASYNGEATMPLYVRANNDYIKTNDVYSPSAANVTDLRINKAAKLTNINFSGFEDNFTFSNINALITR